LAGSTRLFIEPEVGGTDPRLEAVLETPDALPCAGVVVCHPHPLYGGDMDSHVVHALCDSLVEAGLAALRFNFRGAGASEGSHDNGRGERQDALRCLTYLQSRSDIVDGRLGIAGYSFGGVIASGIGAPALACVAVSPPSLLPAVGTPTLVITGADDNIASAQRLGEAATARADTTVEVIPGVDHFWMQGLEDMTALAVGFFNRYVTTVAA
jgi:uncharacterized protein